MDQYDKANVLLSRLSRIDATQGIPLHMSEYKVSSQNGENGILLEMIKRIFNEEEKEIQEGTFLEFGASTGAENNLAFFADWLRWSGTFIEGDRNSFISLSRKYRYSSTVQCLNEYVTKENINTILTSDVDVLSIDIDSVDYYVWQAVERNPKVVVIEYNSSLPLGKKTVVSENVLSWDGTTAYGASVEAYVSLGKTKGYSLVHTDITGVNAFFVLNKYAHLFEEEINNPAVRGPNYYFQSRAHRDSFDMQKFITLD